MIACIHLDRSSRLAPSAPRPPTTVKPGPKLGESPWAAGGELRRAVHAESDDDQVRWCALEPREELELHQEIELLACPSSDE